MEEPRLGSDANRLEGEEWFRLLLAYLFTQTVEYTLVILSFRANKEQIYIGGGRGG